ncbi:MAG: SUMF1/EgtB/PvdO family nonheme iron enzyme [Acidobacteriota bacterium]
MIAIPGSFLMGAEDFDNTKPVHRVKLSPFHLGKYPVTQAQWNAVMATIRHISKATNGQSNRFRGRWRLNFVRS